MSERSTGVAAGAAARVRAVLAAQREEAADAVVAAERDVARILDAARSVATDDEHDPDGPGLAVERGLLDALRTQARVRLAAVDRALERLEAGTYGVCEVCGGQVGTARLEARPSATTCIGCARVSG